MLEYQTMFEFKAWLNVDISNKSVLRRTEDNLMHAPSD